MNVLKWKVIVFFVFFGVHMISCGSEASLCASDEVMIASCHLNEKKHRVLSFCASPDKRTVSYRFGISSKIELNAVFSNESPLSRWVDVANYTVYLGFRRGKYSYVFGVPQETLGAKAFLDVARDYKDVMNVECTNNSFGEKRLTSKAIQDIEDENVRSNGFLFPPNDNPKKDEAQP